MNGALLTALPSMLAQIPAGGPQPSQMPKNAGLMLQLYSIFHNFDWKWMLLFGLAAGMIFGTIIFSVMLLRRWHSPRMGFFLLTIIIGVVRAVRPEDKAWLVPAGAGVVFAISLLINYFARGEHDWRRSNLKEPIYYLLNAFALCMFILPYNAYSYSAAAAAVFASLFFLVSIPHKNKDKYKKRVADSAILDSLEKRIEKGKRGMR